ncbi:MAG: hypothetical protein GY755_14470 [Chloroflexi bacterium]|nr:hypothetical protein [Chloroflexota bacterium]
MPTKKKFSTLFLVVILLITTLACTMSVGGPDDPYPDVNIPVSPQSVESMQEQFKGALEAGIKGETIILTITETQLTSFLASKLKTENDPFFADPQVYLRDGQMQIFGKASQGYFIATVKVLVTVGIDAEGQPAITIVSADFGPLPAPPSLAGFLSDMITEAYTGAIGPVATGFRVEQIAISSGFMVISGKVK